MDEDEQERRRRKVEAGKAKLTHFRQRKTKGDSANSKKKTAKRKGTAFDAPVPEESPVVSQDDGLLGAGVVCKSATYSDTPNGARGSFSAQEQEQDNELVREPKDEVEQQPPPPLPLPQIVPTLELEALRLSLNNMHTAQLELTQANLQKEKETALSELREMLNGRRAQELALLQNRQQCELELVREQHAQEKEAVLLRCEQETAELKEKLRSEMEKNVQMMESLKQDWESERQLCLENLRKELSAKHQSEMEDLQNQFQKELAEQKSEMENIFQAKNEAEVSLKNLEAQHQTAIKQLQENLQLEHCQYLQDLELKFREKEKEKQLELETLQASYENLKAQSQEEIRHLWSQLETVRINREELNESREPLCAQASHLEELEHLRWDFARQQQQDRAQHECELEQLRVYFEKKLRDAEKTYQEDLTLFQQRLQEAREDSPPGSAEVSSSCIFLEETSGRERKEHLDQLDLQLEQQQETLICLPAQVEEDRGSKSEVSSALHVHLEEDESDRCFKSEVVELEPLLSIPSDQHSQDLVQVHLQYRQDTAMEVDAQVAARILGLEAEHKVKLSLLQTELKEQIELLKIENRNLHEKLQHETHLKEDLENVKHSLVEDHKEELNKAEEKIQLMKQELKKKEVEWELSQQDLKKGAEERLALMLLELREKAESEKHSIIRRFELREKAMKHLQDQQTAQILGLEKSLRDQQGRLRQLEHELAGDEALLCSQCGPEPSEAEEGECTLLPHEEEDCALQLMLARNRFLEERKEIMEKFAAEQDAFLRDTQEKHTHELQLLQQEHQQQLLLLRTELEKRHQAELAEQRTSLESEERVLFETRVAELQVKHAAEISALEMRHLSNLDALESCYLADIQSVQDEHRKALELLQVELTEQLQKKDSCHQAILTQELEKLKVKHDGELQSIKDNLRVETSAKHSEPPTALPVEVQGGPQELPALALHDQRCLLEEDQVAALDRVDTEVLFLEGQHQATLQHLGEVHAVETQKLQAELARPQEGQGQAAQLKDQVLSLRQEIEQCHTELERLQQRRERENQEGATLICMLRADVDLSQSEGKALRDALRRLLGLFGETLKVAVALKSRISERVGFFLDHMSATETGQAPEAAPALDEMWSDTILLELDRTLPEGAEMSSVAEISSHVCESFLLNPESTLECEQPIRKFYQSLGMAVDGLLEMALDSSRQLEEARQIHSHFEKEFLHKNEETAQLVQKQQEMLERLQEESATKAELVLELHTAESLLEGFKVEKADLQEALGQKEELEHQLVLELESLRQQLQQAAQDLAALRQENATLWSQKEALIAEAEAREAALQKEMESLTREQSEARKQSEKDRASLLSQMKILESELEDQLSQHQGCAQQVEEVATLKQQLLALDKHLRSQRQFMDEQAVEREHEREEFQQEIQRLEEQLRQVARPRLPDPLDSQIELLQEKLREKSDGFNELVIKKELADQQLLTQKEEIKHLEVTHANTQRQMAQLQEELEKQKKTVKELQDKEALKGQQMSDSLLMSMSQSTLSEGRCPMPPLGHSSEDSEVQLETTQRKLLQHETEVLDLKKQLENTKFDLVHKNEEILHLNLKLENNPAVVSVQELQEENASLKIGYSSSEVEELKAIIENLQENQERLQKDKAEEIEQLHEVIEKLQSELTSMGPVVHELSDCQTDSLHRELLCFQAEGPGGQALRAELEATLSAKEALSQVLAEQGQGHSQALEALQQRLQTAEEAATQQLAELGRIVTLREAEVEVMASRIQEFEAVLKAKEAIIVQRDLEIDAMKRRGVAHSVELEALLLALTRFCYALERQPLAAPDEPPELQQLRVQCARLSRQLQLLHQQFLRCQVELDQQQAHGVPGGPTHSCMDSQIEQHGWLEQDNSSNIQPALASYNQGPQDNLQPTELLVTPKDSGVHKAESMISVLTVCQRQLEAELLLVKSEMCLNTDDRSWIPEGMQGKEKQVEDYQLHKVNLIAQVKQLQKKLNQLVCSVAFQDINTEHPKFQQCSTLQCLLENGSDDGFHNSEDTDGSPLVDTFDIDKSTQDLIGGNKSRNFLLDNKIPAFPTQEKLALQDGPVSSQTNMHRSSCHTEGVEPQKDPVRAMDLSCWSSPEVLRKDSTLEPQPSLPLTPCSGAVSLRSTDTTPKDWKDSPLWANASELPCHPGTSPQWAAAVPAEHHHVETALEKDVEDFIITSFDSQELLRSPPLGLERRSNGSGNSDGPGTDVALTPGSVGPEGLTTGSVAAASASNSGGSRQPLGGAMKEKEVHGKHVKALLQMVFDESHQILALSENQDLPSALSRGEPRAFLDDCPRERQGLLEMAPEKEEKDPSDTCLAWSEELLQAVQEAFEKQLQPRSCSSDLQDYIRRLEKIIQEQGDLKEKSQEHLSLPDRSSLLSEIQALRAQLRMTHLQNQEKLQQLCTALTSSEARGSQREHQLRRQVELLAYKVEQEKCIVSDLQKTLGKEQEKVSEVQKRLAVEQSTVQELKSELHECKQENSRLLESLGEMQREIVQLRSMLDGKEKDLKTALEELECERRKEQALQAQQEEERQRHLQWEGQNSKALEELKISLEKQRAQNNQLCVALKHERTAKDNLQKELQIECSRCEALLAQEQSQLCELQKNLEAEKIHSLELLEALQHERLLTEQLSRSVQEACARQETQGHHTLLRKLKSEKARTLELQVMLEKMQQQAAQAQQQLEAQAQERCAELRREKERELELQHQRDEHKIEQLQQKVKELRWKEEVPWGDASHLGALDLDHLQEQQQDLEKIRQQLLCVVGLLTSFVNHTMDRTMNDWTSSNEKAVSSLVHTLEELKSELSMPASSQKRMTELQVQLMDVLLKDNNSLTKAVSTATREKAELCREVSRLEKTLKHHVQKGCALSRPSRSVWKQDGAVLQSPPRHSELGQPSLPVSEEANTCHVKMEKLYLYYLRAESFRKALIYQKKYLLLLIGGFQDSEQETLSMIAHLGVFPSKADKKVTESRPFTKFRTAVRVVIAVLRLRFLVRKWQEIDRKGALAQGRALRPGLRAPRRRQSSSEARESLPTRDVSAGHAKGSAHNLALAATASPSRSTSSPNSRLRRSLTVSQDPEHSLTEYIHHLEMIQQRLTGVVPDSTSKKSCHQKIK
ncbi:pericentrin isoform X2 [Perognathus longimembris pacificus]|uniref:pericentrin isoform X2 n=1 Tax=Perognathus longimembris pacificus TaxID=214514 RepID=UPI002019C5D5|nr:pericentrin isoform X2 [Perognathus longimembris pacificus]